MRQSFKPDKTCGDGYRAPRVHVIDMDLRSVVCASTAGTEDYDIQQAWDILDNE